MNKYYYCYYLGSFAALLGWYIIMLKIWKTDLKELILSDWSFQEDMHYNRSGKDHVWIMKQRWIEEYIVKVFTVLTEYWIYT